jgi:hypothetical protein
VEAVGVAIVGIAFTITDVTKETQPVVVSFTVIEYVFAAKFENVGLD